MDHPKMFDYNLDKRTARHVDSGQVIKLANVKDPLEALLQKNLEIDKDLEDTKNRSAYKCKCPLGHKTEQDRDKCYDKERNNMFSAKTRIGKDTTIRVYEQIILDQQAYIAELEKQLDVERHSRSDSRMSANTATTITSIEAENMIPREEYLKILNQFGALSQENLQNNQRLAQKDQQLNLKDQEIQFLQSTLTNLNKSHQENTTLKMELNSMKQRFVNLEKMLIANPEHKVIHNFDTQASVNHMIANYMSFVSPLAEQYIRELNQLGQKAAQQQASSSEKILGGAVQPTATLPMIPSFSFQPPTPNNLQTTPPLTPPNLQNMQCATKPGSIPEQLIELKIDEVKQFLNDEKTFQSPAGKFIMRNVTTYIRVDDKKDVEKVMESVVEQKVAEKMDELKSLERMEVPIDVEHSEPEDTMDAS